MTAAKLAKLLDSMTIETTSPDGFIHATVRHRRQVTLSMSQRAYAAYTRTNLQHQLARLGTLTFTARARGGRQAFAQAYGRPRQQCQDLWDSDRRQYETRRLEIVAEGRSPAGWAIIKSKALMDWKVLLADNIRETLTVTQFLDEMHVAIDSLLGDHDTKLEELHKACDKNGLLLSTARHQAAESLRRAVPGHAVHDDGVGDTQNRDTGGAERSRRGFDRTVGSGDVLGVAGEGLGEYFRARAGPQFVVEDLDLDGTVVSGRVGGFAEAAQFDDAVAQLGAAGEDSGR